MAVEAVLHYSVLGPLRVVRGAETLALGHPKQRAVLALLLMHANTPLAPDRIIDGLWGERAPRSAIATLQVYVSNLRRVLEPERPARAPASVIARTSGGYQLNAPSDTLDHVRFMSTVTTAAAMVEPDPTCARAMLVEALDLWRGPAFADFQYEGFAQPEISRLEELRITAIELRLECDLALGRAAEVVPELDALVAQHPMRERLRRHQMLALYRAGRQTDALASYRHYTDELREELGLDPSRELSDLHLAVLDHDPQILLRPAIQPSSGAPPATAISPPPHLVGRENEYRIFRSALSDACAGTGSIVVFDGEAGIGKTRLLERLHHEARNEGAVTAFARCVEIGGTPPFWPWSQLVRQLGSAAVTNAAGAYAAHLGPLLPPDPNRAVEEASPLFRVAEGMAAAFRTIGAEAPIIVFLDDLYSSDPDSLSLLTLIGAELDRLPLVIIATHRGIDLGTRHPLTAALEHLARFDRVRRHTLDRFGVEEVGEIVRNVAGDSVDMSVIAAIHDRTDGNAFFTVELTKLLATKEQLVAERALSEVPTTVRAVIDQRIDRLSSDTVRLLRVAAVVGREFELAIACDVMGMSFDAAAEAVDEAVRAGLLGGADRPGCFRFVHIIVVDAIARSLGPMGRALLHGRVADALERVEDDSPIVWTSIAHHRVEAIPVAGPSAAIATLARAGHQAMEGDALELAEQLFEQRRELVADHSGSADDESRRIAALLDLIRVWTRKEGYHSHNIAAASEALHDIWDPDRRGTIRSDLNGPMTADHPVLCALQAWFSHLTVSGGVGAATEMADRLLELAAARPEPYVVLVANLDAMVAATAAGRVDVALRSSARAETALDALDPDRLGLVTLPLGQQSARVAHHCFSGWAYVLAGDFDRATVEFRSARECCEQLGSAFNTGFCVAVECEAAATANSPDWTADALEWGRPALNRGVFGLWDVWLDVLTTWVNGMRGGDPAIAADHIRDRLGAMRDEGALVVHSLFWGMTAELERRAGRPRHALEAARHGRRHTAVFGERFYSPDLERLTAQLHADLGEADEQRAAERRADMVAAELGLAHRLERTDRAAAT